MNTLDKIKKILDMIEDANPEVSIIVTDKLLDPPGPHILYVNEKWQEITGYSEQEVLGKTPRILQGPLSSREELNRLKENLQKGEKFSGLTTNYKKDGTPFTISWVSVDCFNSEFYIAIQKIPIPEQIKDALNHLKQIQEKTIQKIKELEQVILP